MGIIVSKCCNKDTDVADFKFNESITPNNFNILSELKSSDTNITRISSKIFIFVTLFIDNLLKIPIF